MKGKSFLMVAAASVLGLGIDAAAVEAAPIVIPHQGQDMFAQQVQHNVNRYGRDRGMYRHGRFNRSHRWRPPTHRNSYSQLDRMIAEWIQAMRYATPGPRHMSPPRHNGHAFNW